MFALSISIDERLGMARAFMIKGDDQDGRMLLATCRLDVPPEVAELFKEFCINATKALIKRMLAEEGKGTAVVPVILDDPMGTAKRLLGDDAIVADGPVAKGKGGVQ